MCFFSLSYAGIVAFDKLNTYRVIVTITYAIAKDRDTTADNRPLSARILA